MHFNKVVCVCVCVCVCVRACVRVLLLLVRFKTTARFLEGLSVYHVYTRFEAL